MVLQQMPAALFLRGASIFAEPVVCYLSTGFYNSNFKGGSLPKLANLPPYNIVFPYIYLDFTQSSG
jgi:hypothetical protein